MTARSCGRHRHGSIALDVDAAPRHARRRGATRARRGRVGQENSGGIARCIWGGADVSQVGGHLRGRWGQRIRRAGVPANIAVIFTAAQAVKNSPLLAPVVRRKRNRGLSELVLRGAIVGHGNVVEGTGAALRTIITYPVTKLGVMLSQRVCKGIRAGVPEVPRAVGKKRTCQVTRNKGSGACAILIDESAEGREAGRSAARNYHIHVYDDISRILNDALFIGRGMTEGLRPNRDNYICRLPP